MCGTFSLQLLKHDGQDVFALGLSPVHPLAYGVSWRELWWRWPQAALSSVKPVLRGLREGRGQRGRAGHLCRFSLAADRPGFSSDPAESGG